jgi:hypothetical protein
VAGDHGAVLVDDSDGWVSVESEGAGELDVRVGERGPRPPVLPDERVRCARVVGDVQADVLVLRMAFDEARVGDRLAVADRSPGGPHVDEDRCPTELGERERLAVEGLPLEGDRVGGWNGGRRVDRLVAPAAGECDGYDCEKPETPHRRPRYPTELKKR